VTRETFTVLTMTAAEFRRRQSAPGKPRYRVADKSDRTVDGIVFPSKAHARRYEELALLQKAGEVIRWHREVIFDVLGVQVRADFMVLWTGGRVTYEDVKVKSFSKEYWRRFERNRKQVLQSYGVEIEVVER
jgi:hypothetical protein